METTFRLRIASFNFIVESWRSAQFEKILQKDMLYQTFLIASIRIAISEACE